MYQMRCRHNDCENLRCQYFLVQSVFSPISSFDARKITVFRKWFEPESMVEINEAIIVANQDNENLPSAAVELVGQTSDWNESDNTRTLLLN
jgi:hypothetical protein